jgi:gamma-glutamylcyclotransferase (GGCT)/AIG2-like uncharacterized protein YtfP
MKLYFAYGANLNRESMSYRCPRARPIRALYLQDYCLEFATHATIRPESGAAVAGALWEITSACEHSLDQFEGYPVYYRKHWVQVAGEDIMFYAIPDARPSLPGAGYLTTIAEGYRDWNLDLEYLWHAVRSTEENVYDLHRSRTCYTGNTIDVDRDLSGLDLGHDLRYLRDMETAHSSR